MVYFLHMILRNSQIQSQKTILAPSMQQSIEILLLPLMELGQHIEMELQENPLLEIEDPAADQEAHKIDQMLERSLDYIQNHAHKETSYDGAIDEDVQDEKQISQSTCLEDYLLQQLQLELTDPLDMEIGTFIIGNLNEDGFLKCCLEEMALLMPSVTIEHMQRILKLIQHFDPLGIAARDLKECLLIQTPFYFNGHAVFISSLIEHHLDHLGRKRYQDIARALHVSIEEVKQGARMIARLDPKPARRFRYAEHNIYITPDITVTKKADQTLQLTVNKERIPQLRISHAYRNILNKKNLHKKEADYIREKIKGGLFFIKSIEQRQATIRGIAEYILKEQNGFFHHGASALRPMGLKDVARAVDRNESTISRAISNKYIDTPQGMFPLKYFFSQGITQDHAAYAVSSRSIQEELKHIVAGENNAKPFSDQDLVKVLQKRGVTVARRTITKYRKALKILPSHLRKS